MISEIIILYKPEQVDVILARFGKEKLSNQDNLVIFALDYEIELVLRQQGIPYQSLQAHLSPDSLSDLRKNSVQYIREWCGASETFFFQHRGIKFWEVIRQHTINYVKEILYYLEIFNLILNTHPYIRHLWIPYQESIVSDKDNFLRQLRDQVPIKTGKLFCDARGITVSGIPYTNQQQQTLVKISKRLINSIKRALLRLINFAITISRPPQKLKLLVVDKWCNIEPFISKMKNVEIIMLQPEEIKNAKSQAWKKRIRFYYPNDFLTSDIKKTVRNKQSQFCSQWQTIGDKPKFSEMFCYKQIFFWPVLKQFFDDIIYFWSERIISQIECINKILFHFSFNWVLLQGTNKPKFYITTHLAQQHNILTIELQHSTFVDGKGVVDCCLPVDYLAAYGDLTKELFTAHPQNAPRHIIEVGSPRFDRYLLQQGSGNKSLKSLGSNLNIDPSRPVILLSTPTITGLWGGWYFTSYDLVKLFQTLARLQQKTPRSQIIIKLRPQSDAREFYKIAVQECFSSDMIITQYEEFESLLRLSDIVVSYKSTVVLEAMIIGKPVVLLTINKEEPSWFKLFEKSGALRIANTYDELFIHLLDLIGNQKARNKLVENANAFLKKHYRFDGKSSDRIVDFLEKTSYNF